MQLARQFDKAVREEGFRQEFLDTIVGRGLPKYVVRLVYNPIQLGNKKDKILMRTHPHPLVRLYIRGTRSKVEVFPASFVLNSPYPHRKLDDFLSTLEDHEYFHAKEFSYNPKTIAHPISRRAELVIRGVVGSNFFGYMKSVHAYAQQVELRAIENQLTGFSKRDCSEEYKLHLAGVFTTLIPDDGLVRVIRI